MADFASQFEALRAGIADGPGALDAAIRQAALAGRPVPEDMATLVGKIREHAYKVIDRDIDELQSRGVSEDEIFELVIATAVGEGLQRLEIARRALSGEV